MSPEERELLEKSLALAEENNRILHTLRRAMIRGRVLRIIYWALIIGSAVGAYYFIQPYIDAVIGVYGGARENIESVNSFFENWRYMPR